MIGPISILFYNKSKSNGIGNLFYKCGSREENRHVSRCTICPFQVRR